MVDSGGEGASGFGADHADQRNPDQGGAVSEAERDGRCAGAYPQVMVGFAIGAGLEARHRCYLIRSKHRVSRLAVSARCHIPFSSTNARDQAKPATPTIRLPMAPPPARAAGRARPGPRPVAPDRQAGGPSGPGYSREQCAPAARADRADRWRPPHSRSTGSRWRPPRRHGPPRDGGGPSPAERPRNRLAGDRRIGRRPGPARTPRRPPPLR